MKKGSSGGKETSRMLFKHMIAVILLQGSMQVINFILCRRLRPGQIFEMLSGGILLLSAAEVFYFLFRILRSIRAVENKICMLSSEEDRDTAAKRSELNGTSERLEAIELLVEKETSANVMKKQAEINALQSQINPHFLYNTLETIRGQAICCGAGEIAETTKALADIFRFNISKKGSMIFLYEEMDNIDAYMKIQKIRFSDRFSLKKELEPEMLQLQIPKLLIQPLVENALKHGLELKRGEGHIRIYGQRTEETLFITVADDGIGMTLSELKQLNERIRRGSLASGPEGRNNNIGLVNINERIKMIYGPKYGITIRSVRNVGTKVTVSMGIKKT